jgi:hypothetical protein
MSKYALIHSHDSLGGAYEKPICVSEHDSLSEAIHAQLVSGHGYIKHISSGLQRHSVPCQYGRDDLWLDADGNQHDAPEAE